jgi:AMIN domain
MSPCPKDAVVFVLWVATSVAIPVKVRAQAVPSIRQVQVLRGGTQVEIEIESSAPIVPQTNELGGPDRLLVDFVNAKPGAQLRNQLVNRAEVKDVRVGLFSADPPVTRIVLDLNGPQPYQVFPSGRTTIVKIGAGGGEAGELKPISESTLTAAGNSAQAAPVPAPAPAKPSLEVSFHDGMLAISADRATLSDVLFAVHQRTGAEIGIPAGAEQEKIAVQLGPAPAAEVLAQLLNGSKFNFLILSSANDPHALDQVILSPRAEGPMPVQAASAQPVQPATDEADEQADQPPPGSASRPMLPPRPNENPSGETQPTPPANDGVPN